jgi:hypothetical protein
VSAEVVTFVPRKREQEAVCGACGLVWEGMLPVAMHIICPRCREPWGMARGHVQPKAEQK